MSTKSVEEAKVLLNKKINTHNLGWLKTNTLFLTAHGSIAYGTNTETSDVDVKGICVAPIPYYLGCSKSFEQAEFKEPDAVIYEIRKFFKLAKDCNPSIIEVLFTDEADWLWCHPVGREIVDNRHLFLSKRAYYRFFGFARAQLERINSHYKWLKNPPSAPPERTEFGLPERSILSPDQLGAAMEYISKKVETWDINWGAVDSSERIHLQERVSTMVAEIGMTLDKRWIPAAKLLGYEDNFIFYLQKEKEYKQKCAEWDSYQHWQKTRNPQRAELEKKFGFDTKHSANLYRLIVMCREILTTGKVIVKRPDAEHILGIRNGSWKYEEMIEWADQQEKGLGELYKTSTILPKCPNEDAIDNLCMKVIQKFHNILPSQQPSSP